MRHDPVQRLLQGPSSRSEVEPFIAMDVLREANALEAQGRDILHLEVGQPGAPAPQGVREVAAHALERGAIGYTDALGLAALRRRIARHYGETFGLDLSPERVVVTTGSSAGFVLAFLGAFEAGARIALPSPGYPAYRNILKALDMETVWLETSAQSRWMPTPDMLEGRALDGVLVASPANPSGTVIGPEALQALLEASRERGMRFISDEIYHGLTYGMAAETALRFDDEAIVINSFSKYYCMTGWRIGWMVVPERFVRPMERLAQNLYISPPTLSQWAAIAAFDCTHELELNREVYAANRALLQSELPKLGLGDHPPMDGAFYAYVDVSKFTGDSADFARAMLRETGVAATPGLDFDPVRGSRYMRLSFAGSTQTVSEALARLRGWLPG